jgi:hypothetical protein
MLIKLLIAVGGYYLYRRSIGRRRSRTSHSSRTAPRSPDAIGAAGEAATEAKLRKTLRCLCGEEFYLHDGPLVIEHAPGTAFPTAEIDHLAITPFGIIVFETKNWSGHIGPSVMPGKLTRTSQNGETDDRPCPIAQNRTKLRFLREQLPALLAATQARRVQRKTAGGRPSRRGRRVLMYADASPRSLTDLKGRVAA